MNNYLAQAIPPKPPTTPIPSSVVAPPSGTGTDIINDEMQTGCGADQVNTALGCISTKPDAFASNIITLGVSLGGTIALILMLYGFFTIATSAGIPDKIKAGQEIIVSAVGGLILIIFSVILLNMIGVNILNIPGLG